MSEEEIIYSNIQTKEPDPCPDPALTCSTEISPTCYKCCDPSNTCSELYGPCSYFGDC